MTYSEVEYLDRAAGTGPGRDYKAALLAALELRPGHIVLDVGCGPGTDLPALAAAVGEQGSVIGVDHDPTMVAEAGRRVADLDWVRVRVGDAHALPVPDATVDRARCDRVLQHVADPMGVVAQLRRVVRAGGLIALAEPDWDTLVIDDPDLATSRAYTRYVSTQVVRNATIGRQLGRLAEQAGFPVRSVQPIPVCFTDPDAAEEILRLHSVAERGVADGALDPDATAAWLQRREAEPAFLACFTFFAVVAG
ncbi:MAG: methyltransferase domain-containing protein [Sporichthyaceae bacterium]|nr:methyltransferase domain-containing protein [Sporichthyaceae bacterium]